MKLLNPLTMLALCVTIASCETDRPPFTDGGGFPPVIGDGGSTDAGTDGGADAGDGGQDGGTNPSLQCIELPEAPNRISVSLSGGGLEFDARYAFSVWNPNACAPLRFLGLGFNTDPDICGDTAGQVFEISISDTTLQSGFILPFVPISIVGVVPLTVRLNSTEDRVWGNCAGSTGFITFQEIGLEEGETIRLTINATLTNCDTGTTLAPVTVSSEISVPAPFDCE